MGHGVAGSSAAAEPSVAHAAPPPRSCHPYSGGLPAVPGTLRPVRPPTPPGPLPVAFVAGASGRWRIDRTDRVRGDGLPAADRLEVVEGRDSAIAAAAAWVLRGVTSNERYVTRAEHEALAAVQEEPGRPTSTRAALIPIRKSDAWWALPQDERRAIFEERSRHVATGLGYLPAIARRLHHSRDLGEPFDFLTWFEYAAEHESAFDELVSLLRATAEWTYVEREVDIRLVG